MSKFYIDHHGQARFDPTPDNREFRRALVPLAALHIIDIAERTAVSALSAAQIKGEDLLPHLRSLVEIEQVKAKAMAIGR